MATWFSTPNRQAPPSVSAAAPLWIHVNLSASDKRTYNRSKDKAFKLKATTTSLRFTALDHNALKNALNEKFRGIDCEFHPDEETHAQDGVAGLTIEALVDSFKSWERLGTRLTASGYNCLPDDNGRMTLFLFAKLAGANAGESTASVDKGEQGGSEGSKEVESTLKLRAAAFDSVVGLWPRELGLPYSWNSTDVPKWVRSMILLSYSKALKESGVAISNVEVDLTK